MPYDVLRDDLYDKNPKPRSSGSSSSGSSFLLHAMILLLILVLIGALVYFFWPEDLFSSEQREEKTITLLGELNEFNETYVGDLNVTSSQFTLLIPSARFDDSSKTLAIQNFTGRIFLFNNSIHYEGNAQSVQYAGNFIKLNGQEFTLESRRKTNTKLFYEKLLLDFGEGRLKLGNELNFEFQNAKVDLKNYTLTMTYDGSFSFSGKSPEFTLDAPQEHLSFHYYINQSKSKK